jgi:hypothetical protein
MLPKKATLLLLSICVWMLSLATTPVKPVKLRLIVFQGSDSLFIRYITENDITIERIDFPQRIKLDSVTQERNEGMADKFEFQGQFPTVILANSADSALLKMNPKRNQTVKEFITILKEKIP